MARFARRGATGMTPITTTDDTPTLIVEADLAAANGQAIWPPTTSTRIGFDFKAQARCFDTATDPVEVAIHRAEAPVAWRRVAGVISVQAITSQKIDLDNMTINGNLSAAEIYMDISGTKVRLMAVGIIGKTLQWSGEMEFSSTDFT